MALTSMQALPDVDVRSRFGQISIGYDKVLHIKEEFAALLALAAAASDCAADDLTLDKVRETTRNLTGPIDSTTIRITVSNSGYECPCGFTTKVRRTAVEHASHCEQARVTQPA